MERSWDRFTNFKRDKRAIWWKKECKGKEITSNMLNDFSKDTSVRVNVLPLSLCLSGCGWWRCQCVGPLFWWLGQDGPGLLCSQYTVGPVLQNHQRTHGNAHNRDDLLFSQTVSVLISDFDPPSPSSSSSSSLLGADRERLGFLWTQVLPQVSNCVWLQQCRL